MKLTIEKIINGLGRTVPIARYDQNTMEPGRKYPLLIFLHGRGEYSTSPDNVVVARSGNHADILRIADERKDFLVIAPQFIQEYNYDIVDGKPVQTWKPDFTGGHYVDDVLNWALKNMPIDPNKIYITGLSSGGSGTWESLLNHQEFTDKFAAALPVCGGEQIGNYDLPVKAGVAVWAHHGANDTATDPNGAVRSIKKLNDRGIEPEAQVTLYPGIGHNVWPAVYSNRNLYSWLLAQSRNETVTTSTTTTSSTTTLTVKIELGRTWIPKLGKFIYIYDDGSTELK